MAARMPVECDRKHEHTVPEGGNLTGPSCYYPEQFAARAVRAMVEDIAQAHLGFLKAKRPALTEHQFKQRCAQILLSYAPVAE